MSTPVAVPNGAIPVTAPVLSHAELKRLEKRLMLEFSPPLQPEEVQRCLVASVTRYRSATVHNFLSILIEREAHDRLRTLRRLHQLQQ